ncbi:MAG: amylo-alpha-1,6-glucosidase [Candidatus Eremiobacteraeota bacterium]|nr:amylo-alpha-1,6-glucosidase [Candidatus Eremiobacteraeota bacterium]
MKRCLLALALTAVGNAQEVPRFALPQSPLKLERATHGGVFFDVAGPRSAFFGLENGAIEGWLYPLKVFQDFELAFRLEGYPVDIQGRDIQRHIELHPEYTVLTYSHSAFTVRQILLCPRSQPALVSLLDVDSSLPMTVTAQIRPRLRLMWPGALSTQYVSWDEKSGTYRFSEESGQASAVFGSPGARDLSTMPYQEEPKDTLLKMEIQVPVERAQGQYIPIVAARTPEAYRATLQTLPALTQELASHYRAQREGSLQLELPDKRLEQAYDWSLVGMDKGVVHDPLFKSPGLVAGFRTSGESERPGFAWFFGRDAMWTAMALLAQGDLQTTRTALDFLAQHQREDGKIPHEISQSAPLVDWFKKYAYAWASSDATPLYLVVQGELFAASGDRQFLARHWPGIKKAWQWTAASDTDGDGLKENTGHGHAWVEGGALYPAHQELYLQGVFLEAARHMKAMAGEMGDTALAQQAQAEIAKVQAASERTYWLEKQGHYAFATFKPRQAQAEPGPNRARRQQRLDEMARGGLAEEDTVLPAVPMMWGWLQDDRAQRQLDHMIGASMSTDWGARILSNQSRLYDPLAYHYGSVWPLFTGWLSLAGYRYGRPLVGWQALAANASLTEFDTLGYVTELLSGDYCSAFGRSSHHQIWSEAMITLPLVRGLVGLEVLDEGKTVRFSPQPPAHWPGFGVSHVETALGPAELRYSREDGRRRISWKGPAGLKYQFVVNFPLDAQVEGAKPHGEVQQVRLQGQGASGEVVVNCREGCELSLPEPVLSNGQKSQGLRVVRFHPEGQGLRLLADGRGGQTYRLTVSGRQLGNAESEGVRAEGGENSLRLTMPPGKDYRRFSLLIPYRSTQTPSR